jgi:hypothetical protein
VAPSDIKAQRTYRTTANGEYYVQAIDGQKVIYNRLGQIARREAPLHRFAAMAACEIENR